MSWAIPSIPSSGRSKGCQRTYVLGVAPVRPAVDELGESIPERIAMPRWAEVRFPFSLNTTTIGVLTGIGFPCTLVPISVGVRNSSPATKEKTYS